MYFICKKKFRLLLVLLTLVEILDAQFSHNLSEFQLGAQIGGMVSRTSLTYNRLGAYQQMHPSISLFAERRLFKPISVRTSLLLGQIGSDDSKVSDKAYPFVPLRNFKYKTSMAELSVVFVWSLVNEQYDLYSHEHHNRFSPYFFAGTGLAFTHVTREFNGIDELTFSGTSTMLGLALDTIHALPKTIAVFPIGGGLKYAITPQVTLFGEINFRYTFERYLDGFNYSTSRPNSKDFYYGVSIGAAFRPASKDFRNNCPRLVL